MKPLKHFVFFIFLPVLICLSIGIIAGWVTSESVVTWYPALKQPSFTPPSYVFGPIWTVLYILMGIAWGMIWKSKHPLKNRAQILFIVQLIFNALWSFIFFSFHLLILALVDLSLIIISLSCAMFVFWKIRRVSAYLLIPYWVWSVYACAINIGIVSLNSF